MTNEGTLLDKHIYKLTLFTDRSEHYYTSLAAIYTDYTDKDLGACLGYLYVNKIDYGRPYINKRCMIQKFKLVSKKQEGK